MKINMNILEEWVQELSDKSKQKIKKVLHGIQEDYLLTQTNQYTYWSPSNDFQDQLLVKLRELQILDIDGQITGGIFQLKINYSLLKHTISLLEGKQSINLAGETIYWPNEFEWNEKEKSLFLGGSDRISFGGDRLKLFRELALNKGEWVRKDRLVKVIVDGGNTEKDIWSIVPQMNRRIKNEGYSQKIKIVSTTKDGISYFRLQPLLS